MAEEYRRPIPVPDEDSKDFWEGCKRHELIIKHCNDCGHYIHLPKQRCPKCWSTNVGNAKMSGRGTINSTTVSYVPGPPGFTPPFLTALVDLEEAPYVRLLTTIVGYPIDDVKIGMPVEVVFDDVMIDGEHEASIPAFRPLKGK